MAFPARRHFTKERCRKQLGHTLWIVDQNQAFRRLLVHATRCIVPGEEEQVVKRLRVILGVTVNVRQHRHHSAGTPVLNVRAERLDVGKRHVLSELSTA
nr:hypothetical protein [Achromobacter insolitus]